MDNGLTDTGAISLGALIDGLKKVDQSAAVLFDFCGLRPGKFHSDRGNYDHLQVEALPDEGCNRITVAEFLTLCEAAVGKVFVGWKGGEYRMERYTPVWVGEYGDWTGTAIVGVRETWRGVILDTRQEN